MNDSALFEWDELNLLRESVPQMMQEYRKSKDKGIAMRWCNYMEFVLCLVYAYGWKDAEEIVGIVPYKDGLDDKAVNLDIDGETFRDRIERQLADGSPGGILRIIDTESHRDYNTAVYDAGKASGITGLKKRWNTRMDDKVRDAHAYMEGMTVGMDDLFYTYTGESTLFPGGFGVPELDCGCRCSISLIR